VVLKVKQREGLRIVINGRVQSAGFSAFWGWGPKKKKK
jgi:hypothetical protein